VQVSGTRKRKEGGQGRPPERGDEQRLGRTTMTAVRRAKHCKKNKEGSMSKKRPVFLISLPWTVTARTERERQIARRQKLCTKARLESPRKPASILRFIRLVKMPPPVSSPLHLLLHIRFPPLLIDRQGETLKWRCRRGKKGGSGLVKTRWESGRERGNALLPGPLPSRRLVTCPDLGNEGVVGVGVGEEGADGEEDCEWKRVGQ
jgi:hypothetical protein